MSNNGTAPRKVLIYGDVAVPTGFGRIGAAVAKTLTGRGYNVMGACVQYDGLLPHPFPFWVAALQGKDGGAAYHGWAQVVGRIVAAYQPDIVLSVQDFPYHTTLRQGSGIDWSTTGHVVITPVDGTPIDSQWRGAVGEFDGFMTISQFGVEAFRQVGIKADLCPPGVDTSEFKRLDDEARAVLREKLGLSRDNFVVGVMAMNQGRKDFPNMIAGFAEAYRDVPGAVLYLDCDKESAAGWRIPDQLVTPNGLDPARVRYREDAFRAGLMSLNDRYNLLDLHMVIAHREGYGLPHGEAMATGCPSVAIDYCSGREVIGENERGWLIPATPHQFGTWGGALDYDPDLPALVAALREAYEKPAERRARGERGLEWVKAERTWERAGTAVAKVLDRVYEKRGGDISKRRAIVGPVTAPQPPAPPTMPAGVMPVQQIIQLQAPIYVNGHDAQQVGAAIAQAVGQQVETVMQEGAGDAEA